MTEFLCKDCWLAQGPDALLARCRICGANARVQRLDPLMSIAAPYDRGPNRRPTLVCKFHPEEPLELFCGTCRKPISARALLSGRSVTALMGTTASGKTSLLWVLRERMRYSTDLPVEIRQPLGDSDKQLDDTMREFLASGDSSTTARGDALARNYAWELITTSQWPQESAIVAFHDAGGETWQELDTLAREETERLQRYLDLVGSAIFLIDGEHVNDSLTALRRNQRPSAAAAQARSQEMMILQNIHERLRGRKIPAAVAISKADVLWAQEEWAPFHQGSSASRADVDTLVQRLLRESGRGAILDACRDVFSFVSYFAISAFGRRLYRGPVTYGSLRPSRVEEPLLALMRGEGQAGNA